MRSALRPVKGYIPRIGRFDRMNATSPRRGRPSARLAVLALALAACGGRTTTGSDEGPKRNPDCPSTVPADGAPCDVNGTECEYPSPDGPAHCTVRVVCMGQEFDLPLAWAVAEADPMCRFQSPVCPASYESARVTECNAPPTIPCYYERGKCTCGVPCGAESTLDWSCVPWEVGCPTDRPLFGDACARDGDTCGGDCGASGGGPLECKDGYWGRGAAAPCVACPF